MTLLEPISHDKFDPDWLTDFARGELERGDMEQENLFVLKVEEPILVVGLRFGSLLQTPELWVFLCLTYRPVFLRWSRQMIRELLEQYGRLQVWVRTDYTVGLRFAKAHGFRPLRRATLNGVEYENLVARL